MVLDVIKSLIVLPFTEETALNQPKYSTNLNLKNKLIEFRDIFIAATCMINKLPIATLNKKHFERIEGLVIHRL